MWEHLKFSTSGMCLMWKRRHICKIYAIFLNKSVLWKFMHFVTKSILLQFTHFCVEKNLSQNFLCGEKMTNMRSDLSKKATCDISRCSSTYLKGLLVHLLNCAEDEIRSIIRFSLLGKTYLCGNWPPPSIIPMTMVLQKEVNLPDEGKGQGIFSSSYHFWV